LAVSDPRLLWWIDRSSGLVSLVLLTVVMVLGVLATGRSGPAWRVVVQGLHRELPLVASVLLAVHIGTAVVDSYVPLSPLDVVVPFVAGYRPIWIGLGTLAIDLLVVLVVTSLLRTRLGLGTWRAVHWIAYALWPLAVVHALGSGSDLHGVTVQRIGLVCLALVVCAAGWRLIAGRAPAVLRLAGFVVLLTALAVGASWAAHGPLAPGWAKKASAGL
jgi:sulfoxide reductase heme-binding subunit YedZ